MLSKCPNFRTLVECRELVNIYTTVMRSTKKQKQNQNKNKNKKNTSEILTEFKRSFKYWSGTLAIELGETQG